MEKLDRTKDGRTPDVIAENIEQLRELFPEAFTEGSDDDGPRWKVEFDALKEIIGEYGEKEAERYSFTWHGKSRARLIAQTPSTGTLRPCPEESVNWDTTKNLFIEGDNLEVLKLLQKSYHKKVKMIYIDPPYNTGNDFIYPDKFADNLDTYLRYTGQIDDAGFKVSTNAETGGRYHTNWLNMMYPRLKLARNLLRDDGLIFISIDDNEVDNLRKITDEVFGEECLVGVFVWKSRQNKDNRPEKGASIDHEYVVCYGSRVRGDERKIEQYSNPDNDPRGDWTSANMVGLATADRRPNLHYDLIDPKSGVNYGCPRMGWRYDRSTMKRLIEQDRILWPASPEGRPRRKSFLAELSTTFTGISSIIGNKVFTRDGTTEVTNLFGYRAIDFPKPIGLIKELIDQAVDKDSIVLDFFAGSATTAHALMESNLQHERSCSFVLVQLPEPLDEATEAYKTGFRTISDIGKERIRIVLSTLFGGADSNKTGAGFKVLKLDSSNIKPWDADFDNVEQALLDSVDNIKPDRSEEDVLYELLLKYGLDLAGPIETRMVAGSNVYVIGGGALIVCLADGIDTKLAEGIVEIRDEIQPEIIRVVFKDSGFKDDVAKTNVMQVLKQAGIEDVKSL